ncbi:AAA family ATPase [Siccibacter turicensis]|uniref:AAA family ATPase n=1 Tax=Siccibacter turicensis TaxID=357233 RepID=UPI002A6A2BA2|nr:AAA family ATPase [Siccibacter turicensis]MDY0971211.1 AAA family ATPase [Siccibacter turicensis]
MSKILAVRVDDQLIELLPPKAQRYGNLFDIDSLSLLLGTNGAGKTRILIKLANAVASTQDDSFQFYFEGTKNGNYEPASPYAKHLCAIYYSALPYKRQLIRRKGVINASPKIKGSSYAKRLDEFDMVAKTLDIKTELVGVISYSKLVFRSILIPVVKEGKDLLRSNKLGHLIEELDHIVSVNTAYEVNDYLLKDRNRESLLNDIEYYLKRVMSEVVGSDDAFYMLSSLEYIYAKQGKDLAIHAALSLLKHIGIIKNNFDALGDFIDDDLLSIARDSRLLIGSYAPHVEINKDTKKIEFPIKNQDFSEKIKLIDTPIKIEWSNQSSGLQALVEQFSLINEAIEKAVENDYQSILLLVDEGDAYLHLDWQRKYISIINKFLGKLKRRHCITNLQLIIATHSPLLAADIPGDFVTSLDSNDFSSTFAAPIEDVIANAFSSNSLGEFAAKNINEIYKRAISGSTTEHDRSLTDAIGDLAIQNTLKRSFNNDN